MKSLMISLFLAISPFCMRARSQITSDSLISLVFKDGELTIDSVVMRYLRRQEFTPTPELEIRKRGRKEVRSANFFVEPMDTIENAKVRIEAYIFGSNASHSQTYFLLKLVANDKVQLKIIDPPNVKDAVLELFDFVQDFELTNSKKALLVRALTYAYH